MNAYADLTRRHRRLAILRHLEHIDGYSSNASILTDVVNSVGVPSTRDQITTELHWLDEQGLVTLQEIHDFVVATATDRGVEIALGRARHPDIQRPRAR